MGQRIVVRGGVAVVKGSKEVTAATKLKVLDGAKSDESLLEHIDDDLAELGLEGGDLVILLRKGALVVETTWVAPKPLKPKQLKQLVEYTTDQWCDGVGENLAGELGEKTGFAIDFAPDLDAVTVDTVEVAVAVAAKPRGAGALISAAEKGDTAKVAKLLDQGVPIDTRGRWQRTPLLAAIGYGHVETALLLLERGADVHALHEDGQTPLIMAAMSDLPQVARALLERGARIDHRDRVHKMTAREWAENRKYKKVIAVLDELAKR